MATKAIKAIRVTRPIWDKMLAAYRERPSVRHVQITAGVGRKMAHRAVFDGWPAMDLPPFTQVCAGNTTGSVYEEIEKIRESWDDSGAATKEAARQAAEETMAARISLKSAMLMMKANRVLAKKMLDKLEAGEIELPEKIAPKVVYQLTKSMDAATQIVQRAMEIERKRLGEPEQVLGIQIGMMIDGLTELELQQVYTTGQLPFRILSQHPARVLEASFEANADRPPDALPAPADDEVDLEDAFIGITSDDDDLPELPDPPEAK